MRPCHLLLWSFFAAAATGHGEDFVRTEPLPLLDQLFPNQSLDDAWERYPLISRANSDDHTCANNTIPTIFIPSDNSQALSRQERLDLAHSLMRPSHLHQIVDRYDSLGYVYGSDYKLKKRQGKYSYDYFENITEAERKLESWQDGTKIIDAGYSLIADGMHLIYSPIARITRMLEQETGCNYATCNLYYTPPNNAGFVPHYDWMDVLVIQISGIKQWSVASEPSIHLSNHDQTLYKSTDHVVPRYDEFIMNPGDVLYIPRGITHNATTPLGNEPSLHLTFGIEHQWYTTMEALIQHAINLYSKEADGFTVTPSINGCDVDWSEFLHYSVSEVARIDGGPPGCHLMRQSVPRHEAWKQIYTFRHAQNDTVSSFDEAFAQDYQEILDTISELANATETQRFMKELQYFKSDKDGSYGFVGWEEDDVEKSVACLRNATIDEEQYNATVHGFVAFAEKNQAMAMESLEKKQAEKLAKARNDDNYWLRKWGHTAECSDEHPLALRYGDNSKDCQ
jgi:hypothetical protein